jgi:hypothetical protein
LKWSESQQFLSLLKSIEEGQRPVDGDLIRIFVDEGGFFSGEDTAEMARKILERFLGELERDIYRSVEGLGAVANRQEFLHDGTREEVRQGNKALMSAVSEIKATLINKNLLADKPLNAPEIQESIYHDRIEQARKLLESEKPQTARKLLLDLRKELSDKNPSQSLLFRIATNLGSCAMQLDDTQSTIREIDFAFQLDPDNPKAITNASLIALLKRQPEEAFRLASMARNLVQQDSIATANYIHALFALGRQSELKSLIAAEEWIRSDTNCCMAIGSLLFEENEFDEAETFLRLGYALDPEEPRILVYLAHTLLRPIQQALMGQPALTWKFPVDVVAKLKEAVETLGQAIKLLKGHEDRRFLSFSYILRADAFRMLGNDTAAIADCDIALHEQPDDDAALPIKALALLTNDRVKEAIQCFEKIRDPEAKARIMFPLATAYNITEQPEKVIAILEPFWDKPNEYQQIKIAEQLLWAYSQLSDFQKSGSIINKLRSVYPNDPEVLSVIARQRNREGNQEEAMALWSEAHAYASGDLKRFIALQLADAYYFANDFAKAAGLYETLADLTTLNDLSKRYVLCLFNSGAHKDAYNLAKSLRGTGDPIPVVSQIEAKVLASIGDLKSAQAILQQLVQLHPTLYAYRIEAAEYALRRAQRPSAIEMLSQIQLAHIKEDPTLLLRTAKLRAVLGMGDVLRYAYEGRRAGYSSPDNHLIYASLFVSREQVDKQDLTKEAIDHDCAVILKIGEEIRKYTITTSTTIYPDRGEISPAQAASMKILGLKKGDTFVNKQSWKEVNCSVVEVQSNYVRAFQDTLERFPTMFPTDGGFQPVNAPYDELRDGILKQLDRSQTEIKRITDLYTERKITFETIAQLFKSSPLELWGALTGGRYCHFLASSGQMREARKEVESISNAETLLLELTAILTFAHLGLFDQLAKRFKQLFVTQPIFDVLTEAHSKAILSKPHMTLGKVGEMYFRQEITDEHLSSNARFLDRILSFLSTNTSVIPVSSLLDPAILQDIRDFIGPISTASILAAKENNLILFSDDQMLRELGGNEWKIKSVWTQSLLHDFLTKKIITDEEYNDSVINLVLLNYKF